MKIHYRKSIAQQIIAAKDKNDTDLGEQRIDYIELTKDELRELQATAGPSLRYTIHHNPWDVYPSMFYGVRIVEAV